MISDESLEELIYRANLRCLELAQEGKVAEAKRYWMDFARLHRLRSAAQVELMERAMGLEN